MSPPTIRGVIFDLGSTLIDFEGDYASVIPDSIAAVADHLLAHGIKLNRSDFILRYGQALQNYHDQRNHDHIERTTYSILYEVLKDLPLPVPDEAVLRGALQAMYAISETFWTPKAAMHTVLKRLSEAGLNLGLLSNAGDEANVQRLIDKAGIRTFFDPILISAALGIRKPDPRPFQQILTDWGFLPGEVVMVGDLLETDVLGAQRLGIHTIWLQDRPNHSLDDQVQKPQPDIIARDLAQVPDLIKGMGEKG